MTCDNEETRARADLAAQASRTRDAAALKVRQANQKQKLTIERLRQELLASKAKCEALTGQLERAQESHMDISAPALPTGLPVDRDSAGAPETQGLRDELALVNRQFLDMTAQRDSFQMRVVQMWRVHSHH